MAPSGQTLQLKGLRELEQALKQLPDKLQRRVTENALSAGGRVIAKEAKALAPRGNSGDLADSIMVARRARRTRRVPGTVFVGFRRPTSARAHLTEYGTKHQPAQPFMRPALDNKATEFFKRVAKIMGRGLAREAAKLAAGRRR